MPVKKDLPITLGLIAGMGDLPIAIASEAKKMGHKVVAIAMKPPADESLRPIADEFHIIKLGRFGALLDLLKKLSIKDIVMAGKIPKGLIYKDKKSIIPDMKTAKLLFSLKDRADDTIMLAFVREFEKNGITVHKTTAFTSGLMVSEGVMTKKKPSKDALNDIKFGWEIAKHMGKLDIGQSVVIKDKAVMAIEAIEGTDEAIKRGGSLAHENAVVIKVSKPEQDMRFDVPVVGINTLNSMEAVSATTLAVEAGKCIIVDKENFINTANKKGISVIGVKND